MRSSDLTKILKEKRKEIYTNSLSILKQYDELLAQNGLYRSYDTMTDRKKLKGHMELCGSIINLYYIAKLPNEKEFLLEDLYAIGYEKDKLVELILEAFLNVDNDNEVNLWVYGDLLYCIKNFKYFEQYLEIIQNSKYGIARQMVILLVGKSKKEEVIPILISLLKDKDVEGHALSALSNFCTDEIESIMKKYLNCSTVWIKNIAKKYLYKNA